MIFYELNGRKGRKRCRTYIASTIKQQSPSLSNGKLDREEQRGEKSNTHTDKSKKGADTSVENC
jgi:hypothetical protein